MRNLTHTEKAYWNLLCEHVGCIACFLDGRFNNYVSIHHINGRSKTGAHTQVLPLCAEHHQTGGEEAPAIHPWKARFEAKYGKQADLLAMCNSILSRKGLM